MAHVLVAVMPLDTQLDDAVRALQQAGLNQIGLIVGDPVSTDEARLAGIGQHPAVASVMQMLKPDATVKVEGLGNLTVSGTAATLATKSNRTSAGFLRDLFGHDVDEAATGALAQQLEDGHALLTVQGDTDKARGLLEKRGALAFH